MLLVISERKSDSISLAVGEIRKIGRSDDERYIGLPVLDSVMDRSVFHTSVFVVRSDVFICVVTNRTDTVVNEFLYISPSSYKILKPLLQGQNRAFASNP